MPIVLLAAVGKRDAINWRTAWAMLDADDALSRHEWLIAPLLQGGSSPDARILLALPVDIDELVQRCPQLVQQSDTVEWDDAQGTLKAWRRLQIGQKLTVKVQPLAKPSEDELHQAMLNGIRDKGLSVLNWTAEAEQLRFAFVMRRKVVAGI